MRGAKVVLFAFATAALGQSQLTLRLDPVEATHSQAEPGLMQIEFVANLHLKNEGPHPVLLLMEEKPAVVGVYVGSTENFTQPTTLVSQYRGPAIDTSGRWKDLADKVLKSPLGQSGLRVLRPRESVDLAQEVVLNLAASKRDSFGPGREDMPFSELVLEENLWVTLLVDVWPRNLDRAGGTKLLSEMVRTARRQEGSLVIEPLRSLPVRLALRSAQDGQR